MNGGVTAGVYQARDVSLTGHLLAQCGQCLARAWARTLSRICDLCFLKGGSQQHTPKTQNGMNEYVPRPILQSLGTCA